MEKTTISAVVLIIVVLIMFMSVVAVIFVYNTQIESNQQKAQPPAQTGTGVQNITITLDNQYNSTVTDGILTEYVPVVNTSVPVPLNSLRMYIIDPSTNFVLANATILIYSSGYTVAEYSENIGWNFYVTSTPQLTTNDVIKINYVDSNIPALQNFSGYDLYIVSVNSSIHVDSHTQIQ